MFLVKRQKFEQLVNKNLCNIALMQFLYPSFLFALAGVSIPIIIHFFNFRRYKKIVFSDIRFIKEVVEQNQKQQKIKNYLVLLCRILAITLLVLAFAQPTLQLSEQTPIKGGNVISIFVDNSFSMSATGEEGELLEVAKNKAREIATIYKDADQFQLLSCDFEAQHQHLVNKKDFFDKLNELKTSAASKSLAEVISRQKQAMEMSRGANRISYILSDFQKNIIPRNVRGDTSLQVKLIPIQANQQQNVFIDSAWLRKPTIRAREPVTLQVRLRNAGEQAIENAPLSLKINQVQKGLVNFSCEAGGGADVEIAFTPDGLPQQKGELSILDNPVTFDDKYFFVIRPMNESRVLIINGSTQNAFLGKIFEPDDFYKVTQQQQLQLNYSAFASQQLIILNEPQAISSGLAEELIKFVEEGGTLLLVPPSATADIPNLNQFCSRLHAALFNGLSRQKLNVTHINTFDEIFKDVFVKIPQHAEMPWVNSYYNLQLPASSNGIALMKLNNGQPFICKTNFKKGMVYSLAIPLQNEWGNFQKHAFFVPFMFKAGLGKRQAGNLSYIIDEDTRLQFEAQTTEKLAHVSNKNFDMVSDIENQDGKKFIYIDHQIKEAGFYDIYAGNKQNLALTVAMNYKRSESFTEVLNEHELNTIAAAHNFKVLKNDIGVLKNQIAREANGIALWRYALLAALFFLIAEVLLLRLMK